MAGRPPSQKTSQKFIGFCSGSGNHGSKPQGSTYRELFVADKHPPQKPFMEVHRSLTAILNMAAKNHKGAHTMELFPTTNDHNEGKKFLSHSISKF